ncbi:MAG: hypothetical protein LBF51_06980 [Zoogloeaceae bacterium]|jgi:hypothetical protein|nr:hypothetical protein [Zoogloeaceae bacterium]
MNADIVFSARADGATGEAGDLNLTMNGVPFVTLSDDPEKPGYGRARTNSLPLPSPCRKIRPSSPTD